MTTVNNADRPFDILVYGATGFTGKRVAQYLVNQYPSTKIAIAGRSQSKLLQVAEELHLPTQNVLHAPLHDNEEPNNSTKEPSEALRFALSQTRIILACAGPYRQCGEILVRTAIENGTDYLDLCGEPQFFDDMLVSYDEAARTAQTLIVSACAFDCVPAELSYSLALSTFTQRYGTSSSSRNSTTTEPLPQVTAVEIVHTVENVSCGNATTFHAAVDGFHASIQGELKKSRRRVKESWANVIVPSTPKEWKLSSFPTPGILPVYHPTTGTYLLKFLGADASCILGSDRYLRHRCPEVRSSSLPRPHLSVCFGVPTYSAAMKFLAYGAVFSSLASSSWGCNLLHGNAELFSHGFFREGGPTQEEMDRGSFTTICTAIGNTPQQKIQIKCHGPEPGYVATPKMIVALAMVVLNHRHSLPFQGGILLPGALFGENPAAYECLRKEGIEFTIVEDGSKGEELH